MSTWRDRLRQLRAMPDAMVEQRREVHDVAGAMAGIEARLDELHRRVDETRALVDPGRSVAYVGDGHAWVRTTWGGKLLVETTDLLLAPWLMLDGLWEPLVTHVVWENLAPGGVFVDVGANIGYYTILAGKAVGGAGQVYAFEAHPRIYDLLSTTVGVNWMRSFITTEHLAVYEDTRKLDFFMHERFAGNSSLAQADEASAAVSKVQVDTVSLDEYFAGNPARIDLIKVDVEGGELYVFRGMRKLLEATPDVVVVCEWSQADIAEHGYDPAELIEEFDRHGFAMSRVEPELAGIGRTELLDTPLVNLVLRRP
jgi:FkbM family methyltransferase